MLRRPIHILRYGLTSHWVLNQSLLVLTQNYQTEFLKDHVIPRHLLVEEVRGLEIIEISGSIVLDDGQFDLWLSIQEL